ncbi:type III pantothenate kinase [Steroidobacter sp. S1-65]|uniref:Type III pantothenate kinase n=1 Tax=Steroidobacter gossypii TaxID=2805490 RepID=A0ABS1X467_9GAMM|nr:type III pantothenate kinase [Steroidobacter gossypii]MBM0108016.1 type III pantothenate kinase [Steroidobacter gossypii]
MLLLIDIGNTRIKWARCVDGVMGAQAAAVHVDWTREDFVQQILNSGPRAERVFIGNVSGKRMGDLAQAAIAGAWQLEPRFLHSPAAQAGLRNAYPEPGKLGVDRWLAMLGARALEPRPLCVVSVGTAMTIDGLDAHGQHLGGVIVPGPDLMVSSLLKNTSDIAQRAAGGQARDQLFADNTLGAIQQGAVQALAALVDRAHETLRQQLGEAPALLLTGGACHRIQPAIHVPGKEIPDLVLRGLAVVAAETESSP